MSRWRCNTCGGEYEDVTPDGYLYFHVCPPIPVHKVKKPDGSIITVEGNVPPEMGGVLETTWKERPNMRDENPVLDLNTGKVRVKSEGKGRTPVTTPANATA
jgi:hypothetical protein